MLVVGKKWRGLAHNFMVQLTNGTIFKNQKFTFLHVVLEA